MRWPRRRFGGRSLPARGSRLPRRGAAGPGIAGGSAAAPSHSRACGSPPAWEDRGCSRTSFPGCSACGVRKRAGHAWISREICPRVRHGQQNATEGILPGNFGRFFRFLQKGRSTEGWNLSLLERSPAFPWNCSPKCRPRRETLPVPTLSVTPSHTQHGDAPPWGTPSALLLRAGRGQGPPPRPCCPQPCPSGPWTGGCSALLTPSDFCSFSCHQLPPWEGKKHLPVPPEAEPHSPHCENPLQQEHLSL